MTQMPELFRAISRSSRQLMIRVDDVGLHSATTASFIAELAELGHVVNAAVVPVYAEGAAKSLQQFAGGGRAAVEVHQHGWAHTNHERSGRKSEFGPARSPSELARDLVQGRTRLMDIFGTMFTPVFCPPWNRLSAEALAFCHGLAYLGVSGFGLLAVEPPVRDLSATVDATRSCRSVVSPDEGLVLGLCNALAEGYSPRVMVHPDVLTETERGAVLQLLRSAAHANVFAIGMSYLVRA